MNQKFTLLLFFLWMGTLAIAQSFGSVQVNSFGLQRTGTNTSPAFADIDADGDFDLFAGVSTGDFAFFLNKGNETAMILTDRTFNTFGLPSLSSFSAPTLADLDGDGDLDMLAGSDNGLHYIENIGDSINPQFGALVDMPFSINPPPGINYPYLVDMDTDGDLDLWIGAEDGNVYYFENTTSNDTIRFGVPVKGAFGLDDETTRVSAAFGDVDRDGDPDAVVGLNSSGDLVYYENTGNPQSPAFTRIGINVNGLSNVFGAPKPTFADTDNDGDPDLMVGNTDGDFYYFENNTPSGTILVCGNSNRIFSFYPNPADDMITVNTYNPGPKTIEIRSITGALQFSITSSQENQIIDVSDMSDGLYLISVHRDNDIHVDTKKLLISRSSKAHLATPELK